MNTTDSSLHKRQAILIADLGYGDAGKGATVDYLARLTAAHTVVRYNGGAQAAHNVVAPDGRHHTFAQFGSATFLPGVRTHLSRFMVLHPLAMVREAEHLGVLGITDALGRTTIDGDALVISPYQQAANRLRELARGAGGLARRMARFPPLHDLEHHDVSVGTPAARRGRVWRSHCAPRRSACLRHAPWRRSVCDRGCGAGRPPRRAAQRDQRLAGALPVRTSGSG